MGHLTKNTSTMNNISRRHHFIPEFYLKGFTNSEGKFKIYDIKEKKLIRNGKEFSPRMRFFEKDGNTQIIEDNKTDQLEFQYGKIDNDIGLIFEKIQKSNAKERFNLDGLDIAQLQRLVGIMYWRLPLNQSKLKKLLRENPLTEFGLKLKAIEEVEPKISIGEMELKIKSDENFFKEMKLWIPNIFYPKLIQCKSKLRIQPFIEGFPSIMSDNPIIFKDDDFDIYSDDFIFPLTNNIVFFRGRQFNKCDVNIKMLIDTIILKQANRYVSCTDVKYVELLNTGFEKSGSDIQTLKNLLFKLIFIKKSNF